MLFWSWYAISLSCNDMLYELCFYYFVFHIFLYCIQPRVIIFMELQLFFVALWNVKTLVQYIEWYVKKFWYKLLFLQVKPQFCLTVWQHAQSFRVVVFKPSRPKSLMQTCSGQNVFEVYFQCIKYSGVWIKPTLGDQKSSPLIASIKWDS